PRNSMRRAFAPARRSLTTPTLPGAEMFALGRAKFGWLNAFAADIVKVNLSRSVKSKFFAKEMWCIWYPGPSRTSEPLLPKRPGGGTAKHDASNQRLMLRSLDGRLPLQTRSGRPPLVLVLDGSLPENVGEKYQPLSR